MFGMGTSVSPLKKSPERDWGTAQTAPRSGTQKKIAIQWHPQHSCGARRAEIARDCGLASDTLRKRSVSRFKKRIKVVKCSSVSTGQLKRLLALHNQPINLVVFQGTLGPKSNET